MGLGFGGFWRLGVWGGWGFLINGYREWVEELEALAGSSDNPEAQVKAKAKAPKEEEEVLCICCSQFS